MFFFHYPARGENPSWISLHPGAVSDVRRTPAAQRNEMETFFLAVPGHAQVLVRNSPLPKRPEDGDIFVEMFEKKTWCLIGGLVIS